MYAHAMQGRSQRKFVYDGVQRLVNGDPPLVHKFSNPVKVRLTPEGEELASRLHAIAVTMGEVESLPGLRAAPADAVPDVILRKPPAAAAVRSASAASPSTAVQAACASPNVFSAPECNKEPKRKLQRLETASAVPSQTVLASELESSCIVVHTPPDGGVEATSPSSSPAHEAQETQNTKKRRRAPVEVEAFPDVSKGAACFFVLRFLVTKRVMW
jgi:hypothetical protein